MADDVTVVQDEAMVPGSPQAAVRLAQLCRAGGQPLTLDRIEETLQRALDAQAQMIGRVTRYGTGPGWYARRMCRSKWRRKRCICRVIQSCKRRLVAAMELLGQSLNQVILGVCRLTEGNF